MSTDKTIDLQVENGEPRTFDFQHALRIMQHEARIGKVNWKIVTKGFEFKNNEIISIRNTENSKKSIKD